MSTQRLSTALRAERRKSTWKSSPSRRMRSKGVAEIFATPQPVPERARDLLGVKNR
jgi:hypothetical protein